MDCSGSSRSASGQINLRCLASSCACSSRFQRTSRTSMDFWPSGESIHSNPLAAARGAVPASAFKFDVESYCFRREATHEVDRLQSFRMREFVCVGSPRQALEFRSRWLAHAQAMADDLALPFRIAPASDPFFGRAAPLIAQSQIEQSLKFELLVPVRSA